MVVNVMGRQIEMRAQNAGADLGHQLFGSVAMIWKSLAHIASNAVSRHGRVHALMVERGGIIFTAIETRDRGHADHVAAWNVTRQIARADARNVELGEPGLV